MSEIAIRNRIHDLPGLSLEDLKNRLEEQHPAYKGLSAAGVITIRGAILMALRAHYPLPDDCLPFLLEELETPHNAYLTAASAHCIRAAAEPSETLVQPLLTALAFMRYQDDIVRLFEYGGQGRDGPKTTATAEVIKTLGWLGGYANSALEVLREFRDKSVSPINRTELDNAIEKIEASPLPCINLKPDNQADACCSAITRHACQQVDFEALLKVRLEDEAGEKFSFADVFLGQPTIVVFFYTRCENKLKCPVTISKLGSTQRLLRKQGLEGKINTAAITYDPDFDSPDRLEQYRRSWGGEQGPGFRMLRTLGDFESIKSYFELGVSYGLSTVNRHRIEVFILDACGCVNYRSARTQWLEQNIVDRCCAIVD